MKRAITFSHERNSWLYGKDGTWYPVSSVIAAVLFDLGYPLLDSIY